MYNRQSQYFVTKSRIFIFILKLLLFHYFAAAIFKIYCTIIFPVGVYMKVLYIYIYVCIDLSEAGLSV